MKTMLRDYCDLISIQVDPHSRSDATYVGLEHVTSGEFVRSGGGRGDSVQSFKFAFEKNDVLYGKLRPYLDKAILADCDGICTTELLVLRPKPDVDPRFLTCAVHSKDFVEHAMSGVTGAQHPRTSWHRISEFEVFPLTQDAQLASSADRGGATDRGQHVPRRLSHCDDAGRDLVTAPVTTSDTQLATSAAFSPAELRPAGMRFGTIPRHRAWLGDDAAALQTGKRARL